MESEDEQLARALAASLADQDRQRHAARTDWEEQEALSLAVAASLAEQEQQYGASGDRSSLCWTPAKAAQVFSHGAHAGGVCMGAAATVVLHVGKMLAKPIASIQTNDKNARQGWAAGAHQAATHPTIP